jgi:sulfur-oxidizing protein SoxY
MGLTGLRARGPAAWAALGLWLVCGGEPAAGGEAGYGVWDNLRAQYYGEREFGYVDEAFMSLQVPASTPDAGQTPLDLHFGKDAVGHLKQVRVFVDNNPVPLAATFDLAPGVALTGLGLRVRVDRQTTIRAIAETDGGRLEMRSGWVQASGGCSAPPSGASQGTIGEIRFWPTPDGQSLRIGVRHPNYSGFQSDPRSGDLIPAYYVKTLRIEAAGAPLLIAELGVSIAENPTVQLTLGRALPQPLAVLAVDSKGTRYAAQWTTSQAVARSVDAAAP